MSFMPLWASRALSVRVQNNSDGEGVGGGGALCLRLINQEKMFLSSNTSGLSGGARLKRWSEHVWPLSHPLRRWEAFRRVTRKLALFIKHQGCRFGLWHLCCDRWPDNYCDQETIVRMWRSEQVVLHKQQKITRKWQKSFDCGRFFNGLKATLVLRAEKSCWLSELFGFLNKWECRFYIMNF